MKKTNSHWSWVMSPESKSKDPRRTTHDFLLLFALCSLLSASAWAQTHQQGAPSPIFSLLPLLVIFGIFYFLLIRPQQKKLKTHKKMIENLKKGDKVITSSGFWATIVGEVSKDQEFIDIEIAKNVRARILKNSISEVRSSETPFPEQK